MSEERRYQDYEIRQILELAIGKKSGPAPSLPAADGLTLPELQDVGREVGLPPHRITQAIAAFEGQGESVPRRTTLGLPTSVGRVIPLRRNPSDRQWELLIAELRTTFSGKGEVTAQGGLREWSLGSLHAFIEPTAAGHRLRLADSSSAVVGVVVGGFVVAFALLIVVLLLGKNGADFKLAIPAFFFLLGGSLAAASAISLPRWAREQERRMEYMSKHVASLLALPGSEED